MVLNEYYSAGNEATEPKVDIAFKDVGIHQDNWHLEAVPLWQVNNQNLKQIIEYYALITGQYQLSYPRLATNQTISHDNIQQNDIDYIIDILHKELGCIGNIYIKQTKSSHSTFNFRHLHG